MFVILKIGSPRALLEEEEVQFVQVLVQEHGENIEDQVNDIMEEINDDNNTVEEDEEDGTNRFIQETFNNDGMDDDGNQFDGAYEITVLQKESEPLYEGSKTILLSAILLLVNLKVVNGWSNTCVT